MEDYPRTLRELDARFATEHACREYLARLRWGQEFVCPACDGTEAWPTARGLWMCAACGHQASVIAGTIFQGTRIPLSVWFRAIWWVVSQKNGASALGLQRVLGLGSYRTAWTWLHKLRRAMVRPGRDRVSERRSRWTRPSWAGSRRAEAADTWGRRRWWSLRPRCGAGPSPVSGCSGWPMPQPTAC